VEVSPTRTVSSQPVTAGTGTPRKADIRASGLFILHHPLTQTGEASLRTSTTPKPSINICWPYLQNAGADAWTVRERDMNTQMLIRRRRQRRFFHARHLDESPVALQWDLSFGHDRQCGRHRYALPGRSRRRSLQHMPSMCVSQRRTHTRRRCGISLSITLRDNTYHHHPGAR